MKRKYIIKTREEWGSDEHESGYYVSKALEELMETYGDDFELIDIKYNTFPYYDEKTFAKYERDAFMSSALIIYKIYKEGE
jgi:hypothetical protein